MQHREHVDAAVVEIAAFAEAVRHADLHTPVPTCPGWDLRALIRHVGRTHRWAAAMVAGRTNEVIDPRSLQLGLPDDPAGLPDWLAAGAAVVHAAMADAPPDEPMWSWGADQHVRFWSRRMHHETLVHRADALLALGQEPHAPAPAAADGVDEFLENLPAAAGFAPDVANLRGSGSIHLHATDDGGGGHGDPLGDAGEWMITLTPEGFVWEHGHGKGSVALRGRALDLLLALYRRRPVDDAMRFELFGERAVLDLWLAHSAM